MRRAAGIMLLSLCINGILFGESLSAGDVLGYFGYPDGSGGQLRGMLLRKTAELTSPDEAVEVFSAADTRANSLYPAEVQVYRYPRGFLLQHTLTPAGWYRAVIDFRNARRINPELLLPLALQDEWVIRTVVHSPTQTDPAAELDLEIGVWSGAPGRRVLRPPRRFQVSLDGNALLQWDAVLGSMTAADGLHIAYEGNRYRIYGADWGDDAALVLRVDSPAGSFAERRYTLPHRNP